MNLSKDTAWLAREKRKNTTSALSQNGVSAALGCGQRMCVPQTAVRNSMRASWRRCRTRAGYLSINPAGSSMSTTACNAACREFACQREHVACAGGTSMLQNAFRSAADGETRAAPQRDCTRHVQVQSEKKNAASPCECEESWQVCARNSEHSRVWNACSAELTDLVALRVWRIQRPECHCRSTIRSVSTGHRIGDA
eukprot:1545061-Rhodomonas_salina.5